MTCQECLDHEWIRTLEATETNANNKVPSITNSPIISSCRQTKNDEENLNDLNENMKNSSSSSDRSSIRKILSPSSINSTLICSN